MRDVKFLRKNKGLAGGEGGIRTHGTVTRTTVFEFYDFGAELHSAVPKCVLSSGIFIAPILSCDAWYRAVMHSWFATWFANSIHRLMSGFVGISARSRLFNLKPLDIIASSQP